MSIIFQQTIEFCVRIFLIWT